MEDRIGSALEHRRREGAIAGTAGGGFLGAIMGAAGGSKKGRATIHRGKRVDNLEKLRHSSNPVLRSIRKKYLSR